MTPAPRTSRCRAAVVLAATGLLLAPAAWSAGSPEVPADPVDAGIDAYLEERVAASALPGLAAVVTKDADVVHLGGYGTAGDERPMTPDTPIRIASLSKSFTAMAVLDLAARGHLDLDAPVQRYVPGFDLQDPDAAAAITIRHLLHQTSGLADRGFPGIWDLDQEDADTRVQALRSAHPVAEPGSTHRYFNPNYEILALVVEEVTGEPLGRWIHDHVTGPLGMGHTASIVRAEQAVEAAPDLAQGHLLILGVPVAWSEPPGFVAGSAGIVSTARDLGRWLIAHAQDGRIDGHQALPADAVVTATNPPDGADHDYGMGWRHMTAGGQPAIAHDGVLATSSAYQLILPETGHGIALVANASHAFSDLHAIAGDLAAMVAGAATPGTVSQHRLIVGILVAAILLGVAVRTAGVVRRRSWAERRRIGPGWRRYLGVGRLLLPLVLLAGLPLFIGLASGRVFTHRLVALAAPELVLWLVIASVTGLTLAVARVVALRRLGRPSGQSAKHSTWTLSGSRNARR